MNDDDEEDVIIMYLIVWRSDYVDDGNVVMGDDWELISKRKRDTAEISGEEIFGVRVTHTIIKEL